MSERETVNLPFDSADPAEQKLWAALEDMPRESPSPNMRRSFYRELEHANVKSWALRLQGWLGINRSAGWLTAATCVLIGIGMGQALNRPDSGGPMRLELLEQNVALLNRELILNRMGDEAAGQRLRGIIDAGNVVQDDAEIARALLLRATEDRVHSVRSAAIDTLGPRLSSTAVGNELMNLLETAESPIVQLALVDLVLRNGSGPQIERLRELADAGRLHPDLIKHVSNSLGSETI